MGYRAIRRGGGGKNRDRNEPEIIKALRKAGAKVFQLTGTGLPDLLVGYHGRWMPLEVKSDKGRVSKSQEVAWGGITIPVVRTPEEALAEIQR